MSALARAEGDRFAPMATGDLDAVMAAEQRVYPFPWTRGNFADALRSGYPAWVLRTDSGELIAYAVALLALDQAHLLNLSVDAPWQCAGYGRRMLDWVARSTREHGARSLLLEVRPSNAPALQLYRRRGFETVGVRRGYYPAPAGREDALVMRVAL